MDPSVALSARVHAELRAHLFQRAGQEDLTFALWFPSEGRDRYSALIQRCIFPLEGERVLRGNAAFTAAYFERALAEALRDGAGLAFVHSHLGPGWQGMSIDDVEAERGHAGAVLGATGLPFVGLTMGTDGALSARLWRRTAPRTYTRYDCTSVRVVGDAFQVTMLPSAVRQSPTGIPELARSVAAWGPSAQERLASLRVGIVGAGSVGGLVGVALARTGIGDVRVVDFDGVEKINWDRLVYATREDVEFNRSKAQALVRAMTDAATHPSFRAEALEYSAVEPGGWMALLDCDVLFSCVDRPWGRAALNLAAYAHLIPVIDGGVLATAAPRGDGLRGADWRAHVAAPGRRCLECHEQYAPEDVAVEQAGLLEDPSYIAGLPPDHRLRRNENVFAFSMSAASFEVLQLLHMVVAPSGLYDPGAQMYHFVTGTLTNWGRRPCLDTCVYPGLTARGDRSGIVITGRHLVAEGERAKRARTVSASRASGWRRLLSLLAS